jgi:hypothetical protein
MSAAPRERVDEARSIIRDVLGESASKIFLGRIDAVLNDWAEGKLTAADACEKVQKMVRLFIGEDRARQIGDRCAMIVMRESASQKK